MSSSLHSLVAAELSTTSQAAGKPNTTTNPRNGNGARRPNRGGKAHSTPSDPEPKLKSTVNLTVPNTSSATGEHPITPTHSDQNHPQPASRSIPLDSSSAGSGDLSRCTTRSSSGSSSEEAYFSASSQMNSSFATEPLTSSASSTSSAYEDALPQGNDNVCKLTNTATATDDSLKNVCLYYNFGDCLGGRGSHCRKRHTRIDIWDERVRINMGLGPRTEDKSREICTKNLMGKCRFGVFCARSHGAIPSVPAEKASITEKSEALPPPPPPTWTLPQPPPTLPARPPSLPHLPPFQQMSSVAQSSIQTPSFPLAQTNSKTQGKSAEVCNNYLEGRCKKGKHCPRMHTSRPVDVHNMANGANGDNAAASTATDRQSTPKASAPMPVPVSITAQASALLALLSPAQSKAQETAASADAERQSTPKASVPVSVSLPASTPVPAPAPAKSKAQKPAAATATERQDTPKGSASAVPTSMPLTIPAPAPVPLPQNKAQKTAAPTVTERQSMPKTSAPVSVSLPASAPQTLTTPQPTSPLPQAPAQPKSEGKGKAVEICRDNPKGKCRAGDACPRSHGSGVHSVANELQQPALSSDGRANKTMAQKTAASSTITERESTPKASTQIPIPAPTPLTLPAPVPPQYSQQASPDPLTQPKTQVKGKSAEIGKKSISQPTVAPTVAQQQNTAKTSAPVSVPSPAVSVPAPTSSPQSDSGDCEEYQSSLPRKKGGRRHNKKVADQGVEKSREGNAIDGGDMVVDCPPESRSKSPQPAQVFAQTAAEQVIVINLPSHKICDSDSTDDADGPNINISRKKLPHMCYDWAKGRCTLSPDECEFTHKWQVCKEWRRGRCARRRCRHLHEELSSAKGGEWESTDFKIPRASDNDVKSRNGREVDGGEKVVECPPKYSLESPMKSLEPPQAHAQIAAEQATVLNVHRNKIGDSESSDDAVRPKVTALSKKYPYMCRLWAKGRCWYSADECKHIHAKEVCLDWMHGKCDRKKCLYLHEVVQSDKEGESRSPDDKTPSAPDIDPIGAPASSRDANSTLIQSALLDRTNIAQTTRAAQNPHAKSNNTQSTPHFLVDQSPAHVIESPLLNAQSSNGRQLRSIASVSTMNTAPAAHEAPLVPPGLLRSPSDSSASSSAPLVPPGLLVRPPVNRPPAPREASTKPRENLTITVLTSTRVTLGPGLEVLDVRTGFESSWILLGNLPSNVTDHDIRSVAEVYGEVLRVIFLGDDRRKDAKSTAAKIEFVTPDQAAEAVEDLHGADVFSRTIIARLVLFNERFKTGELRNCSVRIEFPAPGKIAYAGYATEGEAEWAISALNKATIRDQTISAAFYEGPHKLGPFMVKFEGLPADMDTQELQSYGIAEGCMLGHAAYQSLDEVLMKIRCILEEFGDLVSFELNSRIPKNGKIRAWARFVDPHSAEAAQRSFSGRKLSFLDDERVWLSQMHIVSYNLLKEVYASLASDLDSLQRFMFLQSRVTLSIFEPHSRDSGSRVKLRMSGRREEAIRRYKPLVEQMLNGEKLELDGVILWDAFFTTPAGMAFIHGVSRASKACICIDDRRDMITLYGSVAARQEARHRIINHVYVLRARHTYSLRLSGRVISQLLTTHLTRLHEEIGRDNVGVDITTLKLFIRGDQKTVEHALQILARNTEMGGKSQAEPRARQSPFDCPICYNEVEFSVTLECGHQACRTCMVRYIKSAADLQTFPLTCLGNEATCGKPVSLWTIRELLSKSDFKNLVDASFRQYVQARPREFRYCPSADCPQVYRGTPGKVLQCPSCLIRICSTCNKEDHGGTKCKRPYEDDEELFQKWRNAHDVKSCPGCEAPIEKNEGCNHLTCSQCHTHICWVCLKTFARGFGIYEHMKVSHGGIGLED